MDSIISLFSSGPMGLLFGGLGSLANGWLQLKGDREKRELDIKEADSRRKHDLLMISATTEATIREVEANVQRDQILMEGKADIEENKGRNEAIVKVSEDYVKVDMLDRMLFNSSKIGIVFTAPLAFAIVGLRGAIDALRTSVRPVATYASLMFSFYVTHIALEMYKALEVTPTSGELFEVIMTMITLVTFVTSSAFGFWFMDKSMSRKFQNKE